MSVPVIVRMADHGAIRERVRVRANQPVAHLVGTGF
jgi:hypothetical protein